ncbi:MAG: tetratricopeptide repeat protein [Myxococcales bacterium]|nr:tetratricopeptide repeat protein [Myxococcales bacterium]
MFALHATTIEVYTGAAAWTAALLWAVAAARRDRRAAVAAGLLVGLAAGHHAELRLFVMVAAAAGLWALWRARGGDARTSIPPVGSTPDATDSSMFAARSTGDAAKKSTRAADAEAAAHRDAVGGTDAGGGGPVAGRGAHAAEGEPSASTRRTLLLVAGAAVLGGLCVLYLPLRAAADPWRNWGDPSTLPALWDHLTGARIRAAYAAQFGHFDPAALATWAEQLVFGAPVLATLGLAGFVRLARRPLGLVVPAIWLCDAVYAFALNPMGLADQQNGVPGAVALAVGAAAAIDALAPRRVRFAAVAAAVIALVWAAPRFELYTADRGLGAVVDRIGDALPPDALVAVASDNLAAGLAYAQVVEGARPDLAVVVRQHVGYRSSAGPVARRRPAAMAGWRPGAALSALAHLRGGWPLGWEGASGLDAAVMPAGLSPRFPLLVRGAAAEGVPPSPPAGIGRQGRRAWAGWLSDRGRFEMARGGAAVVFFEAARQVEPESAARWNNLGTALAAAGDFAAARAAVAVAVELDPGDGLARLNLARYTLHAGDAAGARALLDALVAEAPTADALGLRGVVRGNAGDVEGAAADFEAALRIDPAQPEARAGIEQVRRLRARP